MLRELRQEPWPRPLIKSPAQVSLIPQFINHPITLCSSCSSFIPATRSFTPGRNVLAITFLAPANQHSSSDFRASSFQPSLHYAVTSIQPRHSTLRHHPAFQPRTLLLFFVSFLTSLLISPLSNISQDYYFIFVYPCTVIFIIIIKSPSRAFISHCACCLLGSAHGSAPGPSGITHQGA